MARSTTTFAVRFGYARWLRHLRTGEPPGFAEIARECDVSGQAVSGWAKRETPPPDYKAHRPLAAFLGVERDWLIENVGEAPDRVLWLRWIEARQRSADGREVDPFGPGTAFPERPPAVDFEADANEPLEEQVATGTSGRRSPKKRR